MDRKARNREHNQKKKAYIDLKKDVPCEDCHHKFPPYVMEFDHLYGKGQHTVAALISKLGRTRLDAELAKCDVVCANCHKVRTHNRRVTFS